MDNAIILYTINFIHVKNQSQLKRYFKDVSDKDYVIINYVDLINKLIKNDINLQRPNDNVIKYTILRKLSKIIELNESHIIYYVLSELDPIILESFRNYLSITYPNIYFTYNLYVYNTELLKNNKLLNFEIIEDVIQI